MTSVSTLGQALDQVERLKVMQLNLATLQTQLSTGKKTNVFKGLGNDVVFSKRARANLKELTTYNNNIDIAERRIKMMMSSLAEIKKQARDVLNALDIQTQQGEFEMEAVGDLAGKALDFIVNLINEKDGERYIFGGADAKQQPLNDTGTLDTYVKTQLDDWVNGTIDTDALITKYRSRAGTELNDSAIGYSANLSNGSVKDVTVRVEEYTEISFTLLGNNQALRDIVAGMSMIENFPQVMDEVTLDADDDPLTTVTAPGVTTQEQSDNFYKMFNDIARMVTDAIDLIEREEYKLGQSHAQIDSIRKAHTLEKSALESTISDVEDVDINEVAVKLSGLQFQLEASYRVTAAVQSLSLVSFLG